MGTAARLTTALSDRYRIERELGAGGMATVYLAHDIRHDRDIAIKVLHPDLAAALGGERFLSEIRTTARLQHPHILPLLDSGEADGLLFYGRRRARARARRGDRASRHQAGEHSAPGLACPRRRLWHRARGAAGRRRADDADRTLARHPQYMAPEQAMGDKSVDHRADIYALGAVTYEMLTGEAPFIGNSAQAVVAKLLTEKPRPIRVLRPAVSESIESVTIGRSSAHRHRAARRRVSGRVSGI